MGAPPDKSQKGFIFNIQKYSVHDGPGIRTIIFLKGCGLRCQWCSNPESQTTSPELALNREKCLGEQNCQRCHQACPNGALGVADDGKMVWDPQACQQCHACAAACPTHALNVYGYEITVDQALRKVEEDEAFYARSGGGLTLSGGEPLLQADFALALLREAKRRRINTCVETCGLVPWATLQAAAPYLDSVFFDLKSADPQKHREVTGKGNQPIVDNLLRLKAEFPDLPVTVRTPVIPGINDTPEDIAAIAAIIRDLPKVNYELLGYHRMGTPKYGYLGRDYPLIGIANLPDERLESLKAVAKEQMAKSSAAPAADQATQG